MFKTEQEALNDLYLTMPVEGVPKRYWIQYHQGYFACSYGHDKNLCPYSENLSEIYWKRGFDAFKDK